MAELVSIGRDIVEIKLFDTKGGTVKLYKSLTVDQQTQILKKYEGKEDIESKALVSLETIVQCFIEWNVGKDGTLLPCTVETLKQFSQTDVFAMLQAVTGRQLINDIGELLSQEEAAKKVVSA